MAKKGSTAPVATPAPKKPGSGGQRTLHGFFSRTPSSGSPATLPQRGPSTKTADSGLRAKLSAGPSSSQLTPAPSSDAPEPELDGGHAKASPDLTKGLPSPVSADEGQANGTDELTVFGTPSRRVRG